MPYQGGDVAFWSYVGLQPVPGLLVGFAAVVAAHGVRAERQVNSRRVVLSTTVLAYVAAVLAVLAGLLSIAAMLGKGG